MAKVALKTENLTGPQLVNEAKVLFAEVLASFRECHVLCVKSGLFSSKMILEIDTCAVTFRQMCLDTVTVARVVSDQWLDSTIMFFENIKDFDDPTEMIDLLGNQAKEIGQLFKVIAAWARDLGGRFNKAQDNTIAEAEEFKKAFAEAVKSAEEVKERAEEQREKAQAKRRDTQESEDKWKTAQVAVSWIPIGALVTGIGSSIAGSKRAEAEKIEQAANRNLRKAEDELEKRSGDNEKAQYIASKASDLVMLLNRVEKTCEFIAVFWTIESDEFLAQGQNTKTNQKTMIKFLTDKVAKNQIKIWTKSKNDLVLYADAVTVIGNCFNFVTSAKPPSSMNFTVRNLDFTLHIPTTIDVKAITEK